MKIDQTIAYRTSDGRLFIDRDEAAKHEERNILGTKVEKVIRNYGYGEGSTLFYTLKEFIVKNADELRKTLA